MPNYYAGMTDVARRGMMLVILRDRRKLAVRDPVYEIVNKGGANRLGPAARNQNRPERKLVTRHETICIFAFGITLDLDDTTGPGHATDREGDFTD